MLLPPLSGGLLTIMQAFLGRPPNSDAFMDNLFGSDKMKAGRAVGANL